MNTLLWTFTCASLCDNCSHFSWIAGSKDFYIQLWRHCHCFPKGSTISIPISSVWGFQFFHRCDNIYYWLSYLSVILLGMKWHIIVVFICISLMINDVEHLFMCLLATHVLSLMKCPFISFAHYFIGLLVFLLLSCKCSLHSMATNPLSDLCLASISSSLLLVF